MTKPKPSLFVLTPNLADTIVRVHNNGAFAIECGEWDDLYNQARVMLAEKRVADARAVLSDERRKARNKKRRAGKR